MVRYITRVGGAVGMTWPFRVVYDNDDLVALWIPKGSVGRTWAQSRHGRELVDSMWRRATLRLMFPGRQYSVWLFWEDESGTFETYYVNLEEPLRRTKVGFDTNDHTLDIVVTPRLTWRWKDREEFERTVADGHYSKEFAGTVESAAADVVRLIEAGAGPFDGQWEAWRAPAGWQLPVLPQGWQSEQPTLWERHEWAYPTANRLSSGGSTGQGRPQG